MIKMLDCLLDLALPTRCLGCASWSPLNHLGLCRACRSCLDPLLGKRCRTCLTVRVSVHQTYCLSCQSKPTAYHQLFALYAYQAPFDRVIAAFKFSRLSYLGEALAKEAWDRHAERLAAADVVVPVPLPWLRTVQRGFNQAEVIATELAKRLDRPLLRPLARTQGPPQSRIESESDRSRNARRTLHLAHSSGNRLKNLGASKRCVAALKGCKVLLVDDVVTSGATAQRCSRLLRRAGATQVWVLAAGYRP